MIYRSFRTAHSAVKKTENNSVYLSNLTALRGLAAILVAVFHFDSMVMHLSFSNDSVFLKNCYLMVDLFFIMSGFIMLHVYGEKFTTQIKRTTYLSFLRARVARIYPLHVFTLLLFVIIFYGALNPYMSGTLTKLIHNPKAIPTHLLLLQSFGLHNIFTWNLPSWSISAEWFSYLLFPFLAFIMARFRTSGFLILTLLSVSLYVSIVYFLPRSKEFWSLPNALDINVTYEYGYLRGFAGFLAGMGTYRLFKIKTFVNYLSSDAVGLIGLLVLFVTLNGDCNDLVYVPVFMIVVLCIASNKRSIHKICMLRPLQFLGDISYSIYMVHYVLILCLAIPIVDNIGYDYTGPGSLHPPLYQGLVICSLFLVIVIAISSASYRIIEKPWRNRINSNTKGKS